MRKRLLTVTLTVCACTGRILLAQKVPDSVVWAIADVEGGKVGGIVKEKNGQLRYGAWCIGKPFLKDVIKYLKRCGSSYAPTIYHVQDNTSCSFIICRAGLEMIMVRKNCTLRQAIAIYNGGNNGHKKKVCLAYADRVLALAKRKERNNGN